jgi:hypothetical protein
MKKIKGRDKKEFNHPENLSLALNKYKKPNSILKLRMQE